MPENNASDTVTTLERQILTALCTGVGTPNDWNQLANELSGYRWRDTDHKVVYEALRAIKSCEPKTRRDELPAQVTRMGFPDVEWNVYFEGEELSKREIEIIIARLKAVTPDRS